MSARDVDHYIQGQPPAVRAVLEEIRATIRNAAPEAQEVLSYKMPAFRGHGILVYYAAWKTHIGLYPPVTPGTAVARAAARYAGPKGNLIFPLAEPMPLHLISRIVRQRAREDEANAKAKAARKKQKRNRAI